MNKINSLVAAVKKKFERKDFDKFICEVNLPKYKNFALGARLDFKFPITVLVGPNGGGKSSILHALWGMPLKYSTSRFWFSTPVDPIDFDQFNQNRYWYCHYVKALNEIVQCRKMCGNKRHGYWEPTRPALKEGMKEMPVRTAKNSSYMSKSGDRWNQVERTPHYINSKAESSAFERFFYSLGHSSLEAKQDNFVRYSRKLKVAIDGNLETLKYYGNEKIKCNFEIQAHQLKAINDILGKSYSSARYISHALYDKSFSPSVIFETERRSYSECFAGSGELAVVNCVLALEKLERYDLLLLDEPETSLHPGAQKKLIEHILKIVDEKLIQVVISSHSPALVDLLPVEALIVLDETPDGVVARSCPTKSSAFRRLGQPENDKVTIVTEDKLLEVLVVRALQKIPKEISKKAIVFPAEVGASEMLSNQVRAYIQADTNVLMVLDGDQAPVAEVFNLDPSDLSPSKINAKIDFLRKNNVSVVGTHQDLVAWMGWCKKRVILLDQVCPEQLFLELLEPEHKLLSDGLATNSKFKDAVRSVLNKRGNDRDSGSQATLFKFLLGNVAIGSPIDKKIESLANKLNERLVELEKN